MLSCWHEEATKRPSFPELQAKFDNMLSTQGNNPYIDFSINPEKLCYTVEADEPESSPSAHGNLRLPSVKKKSKTPSGLGRPLSVNMIHSSQRKLLQGSATNSSQDLRKSCSPTFDVTAEVDGKKRPSSMMLLQNHDSHHSGKEDEDRYVKDPSLLTKTPDVEITET